MFETSAASPPSPAQQAQAQRRAKKQAQPQTPTVTMPQPQRQEPVAPSRSTNAVGRGGGNRTGALGETYPTPQPAAAPPSRSGRPATTRQTQPAVQTPNPSSTHPFWRYGLAARGLLPQPAPMTAGLMMEQQPAPQQPQPPPPQAPMSYGQAQAQLAEQAGQPSTAGLMMEQPQAAAPPSRSGRPATTRQAQPAVQTPNPSSRSGPSLNRSRSGRPATTRQGGGVPPQNTAGLMMEHPPAQLDQQNYAAARRRFGAAQQSQRIPPAQPQPPAMTPQPFDPTAGLMAEQLQPAPQQPRAQIRQQAQRRMRRPQRAQAQRRMRRPQRPPPEWEAERQQWDAYQATQPQQPPPPQMPDVPTDPATMQANYDRAFGPPSTAGLMVEPPPAQPVNDVRAYLTDPATARANSDRYFGPPPVPPPDNRMQQAVEEPAAIDGWENFVDQAYRH